MGVDNCVAPAQRQRRHPRLPAGPRGQLAQPLHEVLRPPDSRPGPQASLRELGSEDAAGDHREGFAGAERNLDDGAGRLVRMQPNQRRRRIDQRAVPLVKSPIERLGNGARPGARIRTC